MAAAQGAKSTSAGYHLRSLVIRLIILFSIPLILSFVMYLVSTSFNPSGGTPATVGYGLTAVCTTSGGVGYLWLISGTCASNPVGVSMATGFINLLNAGMYFVMLFSGAFTVIGIFHALSEGHET